jgi:hypothetical protein
VARSSSYVAGLDSPARECSQSLPDHVCSFASDLQRLIHEHHSNLAMLEITKATHSAAYLKVLCSRREIACILMHIEKTETKEFAQGVMAKSVYDQACALFDGNKAIQTVIVADLAAHVQGARSANGMYAPGPTGAPSETEFYDPSRDEDARNPTDSTAPPRSPRTRNPNPVPPPSMLPPLVFGMTEKGVLYVEAGAELDSRPAAVPFINDDDAGDPGDLSYPPSQPS